MKIDFSQQLLGLEDEPLTDGGKPVTLARVCVNVLTADPPGVHVDGHEKVRRYELARNIVKATGPIEILEADAKMLHNLVERYPALVMVPAQCMLKAD
jgi:dTDP-4-dehydrorhamnose reductase